MSALIRSMPTIVSVTAEVPWSAMVTACMAMSETLRDFSADSWAVCFTSSTVAVVSLTEVAVSTMPEAIWVVEARISLAEEARTVTLLPSSLLIFLRLSSIPVKALPKTSRSDTGCTATVRSPPATFLETAAMFWR
ncbi:MAG: hypothetical protein ACD_75C01443G0001 [uncultured bacterium]|nr:MAG: hypothetical protein ACD_75C01443G0001 [uncultured bacterium]